MKGQVLAVPVWLAVVTVTCAEAKPADNSKAPHARLADILLLSCGGWFIAGLIFRVGCMIGVVAGVDYTVGTELVGKRGMLIDLLFVRTAYAVANG